MYCFMYSMSSPYKFSLVVSHVSGYNVNIYKAPDTINHEGNCVLNSNEFSNTPAEILINLYFKHIGS